MKKKRNRNREAQCDVFISYRRDGGEMTALYVTQELKRRGYRVFYDRENLRAPVRFNERLLDSIRSCTDFVLILSPHALDRCVNEDDWVRTEIEEALRSGKNIVPVAMNGFEYPAKLPDSIAEVRYIQAMSPSMDFFTESMDRLCDDFLMTRLHAARKWMLPAIAGGALALLAVAAILFAAGVLPPAPRATPAPEPTLAPTAAPTPEPTPEPTAEPTPEPTPEPTAAVAERLDASVQLALFAPNGDLLELLGDRATLDMADYPDGCYFVPQLTLHNPSDADASYFLSYQLDGSEARAWQEQGCAAGRTATYRANAGDPELAQGMTPGRHTAAYSLNGEALATLEYEVTEEKRADLRESLEFEPKLSVYDREGRLLECRPGAAGNARTLPDGEAYGMGLWLHNLGEDAQFSLAAIDADGNVWFGGAQTQALAQDEMRDFGAARPLPGAGGYDVTWYVNGYALMTHGYMIGDEEPSAVRAHLEVTVDLVLCAPDGAVLEAWGDAAPLDTGEYPEGCYYAPRITLRNTSDEDAAFFTLNGKLDGADFSLSGQACGPLERMSFTLGEDVMRPSLTPGRHTVTCDADGEPLATFEFEFTSETRADPRGALNAVAHLAVCNDAGQYVTSLSSTSGDLQALSGGGYQIELALGNHGEDAYFHLVALDAQGKRFSNMEAPQFLKKGQWKRFFGADALPGAGEYEITWYVDGYPLPAQTYAVSAGPLENPRGALEAHARLAMYAPHGAIMELLGDSEMMNTTEYPDGSFIAPVLELRNPTGEDAAFDLRQCIDGEMLFGDYVTCPAGETALYGYFDVSQSDPARYMTLGRHTASYLVNGEELLSFEYELTDGKRADPRGALTVSPLLSVYDAEGNLLGFERGENANLRLLPEGCRCGSALEIVNLGEDTQFHLYAQGMDGSGWYEPEPVRITRGETLRLACVPLPEDAHDWDVFWSADGYVLAGANYTLVDKDPAKAREQVEADEPGIALAGPDGGILDVRWDARAPLDKGAYPKGCLYAPFGSFRNAGKLGVVFSLSGSLDGREWGRIWLRLAGGESKSCFLGLEAAEWAQTPGRHTLTYRINDGETHTYEYELTDEPRVDLRDRLYAQAYFAECGAQGELVRGFPGAQANLRLLPEEGGFYAPTLMLKYDGGEETDIQIAMTDKNGRTFGNGFFYGMHLLPGESVVMEPPPMLTSGPCVYDIVWYVNGYPILTETYTVTDEDR